MRRLVRSLTPALAAALVLAALAGPTVSAQEVELRVIAHPDAPVDRIDTGALSKIFLKKTERWEDGSRIFPVDQVESSPVRQAFSREVHGRSVAAIEAYWQQRIFSGREVPPPEKVSDREVVEFVRATPGAIGYVAAGTPLQGVEAVEVVD
ncbi:MAG: hypothetical protein ACLF0P_09705 [Thermoanaerobaculia bacterium]